VETRTNDADRDVPAHWPTPVLYDDVSHLTYKKRRQNEERGLGKGDYPCLMCGRFCGSDKVKMFHLCGGGSEIRASLPHDSCAGECLAMYPVGPSCFRRHRRVLQPYLDSYAEDEALRAAESGSRAPEGRRPPTRLATRHGPKKRHWTPIRRHRSGDTDQEETR